MGGSPQTVTQNKNTAQTANQTTQANPLAMQFGQGLIPSAQNLGGIYPGLNVASLTPDQLSALSALTTQGMGLSPMVNEGAMFMGQGAGMVNSAGQPITSADINQFYNPMAANVTAQMQNIFGQQNAQNTADAVHAAGGVGAGRIAVAQGNLANQQGLAAGQTYSSLYQNALAAAQGQKQQQLASGMGLAGLAPVSITQGLTGLGTALQAAGVPQQYQQMVNQAQYQQALGQYGQQYQNLGAGLGVLGGLTGLGGTTAGTQTGTGTEQTTYPPVNPLTQFAGLGIAGLGAAGGLGFQPFKGANPFGFGQPAQASGGRIGYADGGSIDGEAAPIGLTPQLAGVRSMFADELTPQAKERLYRLAEAEVGGQGPQAAQAFMETVFNRAAARGQSVTHAMNDEAYYPRVSIAGKNPEDRGMYAGVLDKVLGGSNISNYATGNASGGVGFAGGPQTYNPGTGERFGVEGSDRKWAADLAANTGNTYEPPSSAAPTFDRGSPGSPYFSSPAPTAEQVAADWKPAPYAPQSQPSTGGGQNQFANMAQSGMKMAAGPSYPQVQSLQMPAFNLQPFPLAGARTAQEGGEIGGLPSQQAQQSPMLQQQQLMGVPQDYSRWEAPPKSKNIDDRRSHDWTMPYFDPSGIREGGRVLPKAPILPGPGYTKQEGGPVPEEIQDAPGYADEDVSVTRDPVSLDYGDSGLPSVGGQQGMPPMPRPPAPGPSASPWMALINSGLGMASAAGQRDARGLPMSPLSAVATGFQGGVKTLEQQREQARKDYQIAMEQYKTALPYNAMTAAQRAPYEGLTQAQIVQSKTPKKIGTNIWGKDIYGVLDLKSGQYVKPGTNQPIDLSEVEPDEKALEPIAQKMSDYELNPTAISGLKYRNPQLYAKLMGMVTTKNPDWSDQYYSEAHNVRQAFTKGTEAQKVRSFDVLTGHMAIYEKLIPALQQGDTKAINSLRNEWRKQFGNSEIPTDMQTAMTILRGEVINAVVGGARGGELERFEAGKNFDRDLAPALQQGQLGIIRDFAGQQLLGLKRQFVAKAHSKKAEEDFASPLGPRAKELLSKAETPVETQETKVSAAPKEGDKKPFREGPATFRNGKWILD